MDITLTSGLLFLLSFAQEGTSHPHPYAGDLGANEFRFRGKIYAVVRRDLYQPEAEFFCRRWGGRLATMPDRETQEFFNFATGIDFHDFGGFWLGVMKDGVQKATQGLLNDSRLYTNCTENPEDCLFDTPGPFFDNDIVSETCIGDASCSEERWVDANGNNVTYLPWKNGFPEPGVQCGLFVINDCQHFDGCNESALVVEKCWQSWCWSCHGGAFGAICEKEECPAEMEAPDPAVTQDEEPWETFLNLQVYCGPRFYRVVINTCAKEYVDIQNIRLGSTATSNDSCPATNGNVLQAELGTGTCGVVGDMVTIPFFGRRRRKKRFLTPVRFLRYNFTIHAEFGSGRHPQDGAVIQRYQPITLTSECFTPVDIYAHLHPSNRIITEFGETNRVDAVSGNGAFDIIMEIFSDRNFTQHFSGDPPEVLVPETVYVVASVSRDGVVLQADECWASESDRFIRDDGVVHFDLILNGCPVNDTTVYENSVSSEASFSFESFLFTQKPESLVYIHCLVRALPTDHGIDNDCDGVSDRRRRNAEAIASKQMTIPFKLVMNAKDAKQAQQVAIDDTTHDDVGHDVVRGSSCEKNNGGCTHECSTDDKLGVTCLCPLGMALGKDKRTCSEFSKIDNENFEADSAEVLFYFALAAFALSLLLACASYRVFKDRFSKKVVVY
ncbi:unnamed protein product [Clavelina lepadiformis]|uniref:ZP domain-containing protein n=1 Tax=Clavelina lepadiformis TaxID=159417 RepID=A0ABP0FTA2_CLALP